MKKKVDKIYIVTCGQFSDYYIEKCFLKKEDAEDYLKILVNEGTVEEHDLFTERIESRQYWSHNVYYDGKISSVTIGFEPLSFSKNRKPSKITVAHVWEKTDEQIVEYFVKNAVRYFSIPQQLIGVVYSYESEEHAHKLAVEMYQKFLRRFC